MLSILNFDMSISILIIYMLIMGVFQNHGDHHMIEEKMY